MKILIVYSSRYGATETVSGWIKERFELAGYDTDIFSADNAPSPDDYGFVLIGSGIYAHKFLSSAEEYIRTHQQILQNKPTGVFGTAMRTETFFKGGKAFGGAVILERYGVMLGSGCLIGKLLGGEMIFDKLNEKDRDGLERFYNSIRLSEEDKQQRRTPRTLLDKKQCWDFAEDIIKILKS